jgi:hypothetical protein
MNGWASLQRFLATDRVDADCAETFAVLERYAERVLAGDAELRFPGVAAHLRACAVCAEDLRGLLSLLRGTA